MKLAITLLLTTACCSRERERIHPELRPYVKEFDTWLKVHCINSYTIDSIKFVPTMEEPTIGTCEMYDPPINWLDIAPRNIEINQAWWMWEPTPTRKGVIFHELAHCRLGVDHEDSGLMVTSLPSYDEEWLQADMDAFLVSLDAKGMVRCWPERVKR